MASDSSSGAEKGIMTPVETQPRHQPFQPGEAKMAAQGRRENLLKRFWKARVGWKKAAMEAAVVAGGAASLEVPLHPVVGNVISTIGDAVSGRENVQSQNVVTIDSHPTIEVTTIPGTNIPNPNVEKTPVPTVVATSEPATPTAEKPTAVPATATPTEAKPSPTLEVVKSVYAKAKDAIEASNLSKEEKTNLESTAAKLEKTDGVLARFEKAYLGTKEADGTSTLYRVQTERIKNIDFTAMYPGTTRDQALRKYWEQHLAPGYVGDIANIHGIADVLAKTTDIDQLKALLDSYGKNYRGAFSLDYAGMEFSKPTTRKETIEVDAALSADDPWVKAQKTELAALLKKVPNVGDVHYLLKLSAGSAYLPDVNTIVIGNAEAPTKAGVNGHETGHYLDIGVNKFMLNSLTPEQIVALTIKRAEIINSFFDNFSAENYLAGDKLTAVSNLKSGKDLSDADLQALIEISNYERFLNDVPFEIADQVKAGDAFFGGARTTYTGWTDLISKQGPELDRLAALNPTLQKLVADIKSRPAFYDKFQQIYFPDAPAGPRTGFELEFGSLAKINYIQAILNGEVKLPAVQLEKTLAFMQTEEDREIVADALGMYLRYQDKVFATNLETAYLAAFQSLYH